MKDKCKIEDFEKGTIKKCESVTEACMLLGLNYHSTMNKISNLKKSKEWRGYLPIEKGNKIIIIGNAKVKRCVKCNQILRGK